ncbi:hypothetical protein [Pelotalea chapellei]|uniref:MFS transporter n=1 Tax=Pelotalea chapellei TaxID=44671 RepID=A0ABS5U9W1_9BACT|nr:hypothetical protein [Pelotalea chapellei]MBT1072448.1 hypothetical protein [Pelotalea chapellei]
MNQIKTIFLRYFTGFFVVMLILVSIGQYGDQRKLDLKFSLPFSLSLAFLGGAIAALFIGVFRKLESEPPRVQPSEYLTIDESVLKKGLTKASKKRFLLFAMFGMWLPYGLLIMVSSLPEFFLFGYMGALAIVAFNLQFTKCPRCGHYLFFRGAKSGGVGDTGSEKLNLIFGGGYHNALSNKCLNCGVSIK